MVTCAGVVRTGRFSRFRNGPVTTSERLRGRRFRRHHRKRVIDGSRTANGIVSRADYVLRVAVARQTSARRRYAKTTEIRSGGCRCISRPISLAAYINGTRGNPPRPYSPSLSSSAWSRRTNRLRFVYRLEACRPFGRTETGRRIHERSTHRN